MPAPIQDDEDQGPSRKERPEPPLTVWALSGVALVLVYIVAVLLLRPI